MATEEGLVLRIIDSSAWVKTKKSAACESCGSKGSCNVMGGGNEMEVEAINTAGAKEGDVVVLSFRSSSLLKATFLLYVFPVLCMLAGAVLGNETAPYFDYSPSGFSAVSGFLCFFVSLVIVKKLGNRLAENKNYRPEIIRVKKQTVAH